MKKIYIVSMVLILIISFSHKTNAFQNSYEYSVESKVLLKQLESEIVATLLAIDSNEKAMGKEFAELDLELTILPKNHIQFGVVLDTKDIKSGFKVVSVTKGSPADIAGILVNDLIVEMNGIKIAEIQSSEEMKMAWTFKPNEKINLGIKSSGIYKRLSLTAPGTYLPEITLKVGQSSSSLTQGEKEDSCGVVTINALTPKSLGLTSVKFKKINEQNIQARVRSRKLPVGKHRISFLLGNIHSNAVSSANESYIDIDINPNIKYYIAAKKSSQHSFNASWVPVIWKTIEADCKQI